MKKKANVLSVILAAMLVVAVLAGCSNPATSTGEESSAATQESGAAPSESASEDASAPEDGTGASGGVIKIATKPMTEQFIIGQMQKMLIEKDTDLTVEITDGVGGGTSNIQPALLKGDFDMYSEYTGTGWEFVLKREDRMSDDELLEELRKEYKAQYNLEWPVMYGFGNMYGLAVQKEIAEENGIETFSDLAPYTADLSFGAEYDFFERDDGYDALCETYGYDFKDTKDLDIGLKYAAINSRQVDVIDYFTTDGQFASADVVGLVDDKGFFPTYYCGVVVRSDTLEAHPELLDVLMLMEGLITETDMQEMNYAVEEEGREPADVAEEFLKEKGLL